MAFPGLAALVTAYRYERETVGEYIRVYPPPMSVFRCFGFFNPEELKVVILGQDPYHGPKQATGLCFAVEPASKPPPSLRNIRKELWASSQRRLASLDLVEWARSGVLLLNAALTVREHSPASNMKIWSKFTGYIIDWINKNCEGVVPTPALLSVDDGALLVPARELVDKMRARIDVQAIHLSLAALWDVVGEATWKPGF